MDNKFELPIEVWYIILSFLPPHYFLSMRMVCSSWNYYVQSDQPWIMYTNNLYSNYYENMPFMNDKISWMKKFYKTKHIHSNWQNGKTMKKLMGRFKAPIRFLKLKDDQIGYSSEGSIMIWSSNINKSVFSFNSQDLQAGESRSFTMWDDFVSFPTGQGISDFNFFLNLSSFRIVAFGNF